MIVLMSFPYTRNVEHSKGDTRPKMSVFCGTSLQFTISLLSAIGIMLLLLFIISSSSFSLCDWPKFDPWPNILHFNQIHFLPSFTVSSSSSLSRSVNNHQANHCYWFGNGQKLHSICCYIMRTSTETDAQTDDQEGSPR